MQECFSAETITVIKTRVAVGDGTEANPGRFVTQLWTLEGELLCTKDPVLDEEDEQ